ncbi:spondin domain-containing protein [Algisphaera agarilytica]|uniref:Ice-binding protein C-terminal domain-containing protein n=1 Tax=Algisphaera agarilytica TaxID=1385975 RepID=A0A7X0H6F3_9BACT|nr:spondin domain-containing protein [Algisphaera agarilytica]MBB6430003.1 hypothetical protein [Algisphaera agarilytica]
MRGFISIIKEHKTAAIVACLLVGTSTGAIAQADGDIKVEVINEGNSDFFLTPVWFGFHNGQFDFFNSGEAASASLEAIAEDGIVDGLVADFTAAPGVPGDIQGVVSNPAGFGGAPVIDPGETATGFVTPINPSAYQYFSFASMIIPSNDTFIGNDNPFAYQVFTDSDEINDPSGVFTIQIFGSDLYDAGTEVNDGLGAAFSAAAGVSTDENGTVGPLGDENLLTFFDGQTAAGTTVTDFIGSGELLATINISIVPEPASASLLGLGVAALAVRRRK